jgi:iron complex transport system ATP-binding protein
MNRTALEVRNLCFRINGRAILQDVSFKVQAGAYLSIIGPNGAGKTTLLKCLNRILGGAKGEILVWDQPLRHYSQAELATHLGYVPQGGTDDLAFSVFEFVMMGRYPHLSAFTSTSRADENAVHQALELAGAEALVARSCATLSGGERQRVLIAAALAQEASILLLDEPTTFLDPQHRHDILRVLARINRESGVTILSVTHDINTAVLASDEVMALQQGRVAFRGSPRDLVQGTALKELFGQEFHAVEHPVSGDRLVLPRPVREPS